MSGRLLVRLGRMCKLTPTDLDKLEELAKMATPGPWRWDHGNWEVESRNEKTYRHVICAMAPNDRECAPFHESGFNPVDVLNDADYIAAANPTAILDLIAQVKQGIDADNRLIQRYEAKLQVMTKALIWLSRCGQIKRSECPSYESIGATARAALCSAGDD